MNRLGRLWNGIRPRHQRALRALAIVAAVVAGVWGIDRYTDHLRAEDDKELVDLYCGYGAVSLAQYAGCVKHVTAEEVGRRYDRNEKAAVYAVEWQSYADDMKEESQGSPWEWGPR